MRRLIILLVIAFATNIVSNTNASSGDSCTQAPVSFDIIFNPTDITPPDLNFAPGEVIVDGNYLYTMGGINGLHIWDISNPHEIKWINSIYDLGWVSEIQAGYVYAYNRGQEAQLSIIDIHNPLEPEVVANLVLPSYYDDLCVDGEYAYVLYDNGKLGIFDASHPESVELVGDIRLADTDYHCSISISDGYAYVGYEYDGTHIVDVTNPKAPKLVKTLDLNWTYEPPCIANGYLYICRFQKGLIVVDIDPPEAAEIVATLEFRDSREIVLSGNRVYVVDTAGKLRVINIENPQLPQIVQVLDLPWNWSHLAVKDNYIFAVAPGGLLTIYDPPGEEARIISRVDSACGNDLAIDHNYVYMVNHSAGLQIIDINDPESPAVISTVPIHGRVALDIVVSDGVAYVADGLGITIIDIRYPYNAQVVGNLDIPQYSYLVEASNGFAYVISAMEPVYPATLSIVDVSRPNAPEVVNKIKLNDSARNISFKEGYVFAGRNIVDVDPPEAAHIANRTEGYGGLCISGDYGYSIGSAMKVFDIQSPLNPRIMSSLDLGGFISRGMAISDGVAYLTGYIDSPREHFMKIIDVSDPNATRIIDQYQFKYLGEDICVDGQYAYVAYGGLRVIKLW